MSNSKYQTETFEKRTGATNKGEDYEDSLIVLLAFRLVRNKHVENFQLSSNDNNSNALDDKHAEDFQLSSNDRNSNALDDIVLEVNYKNQQDTSNFAIQLKHKENDEKKITKRMLGAIDGPFSVQKYFKSFKKLTKNGNRNNLKCILYTTATFEDPGEFQCYLNRKSYIEFTAKKHTLPADDFLNTSDNNCVYQFEINQNKSNNNNTALKAEIEEYKTFFKHFFFYLNQKKLEDTNKAAQEFFMKECLCEKDSFILYKDFISTWSRQQGTKNCLNRKTINLKIGECLLKSSSVKIQMSTKTQPTSHPLQEAFLHFDTTIVQTCDNQVKKKVKELFAEIPEPDINEVSRVGKEFCLISNPVTSFDELDPEQKSTILWYMGKLPLILQVDEGNKKILKQAEEFCQKDGEKKKFIFIGKDIKRSDFKNLQVFENVQDLASNPTIQVFQNLQDLASNPTIFKNIVQKTEISLQGRVVSLNNILRVHPDIQEAFSTVELIKASDKLLKIGEDEEKLPKPYIKQLLPKYVTDFKFFTENNIGSLSVINCHKKLEVIKKQMTGIKLVKVKTFLKDGKNYSTDHYSSTFAKMVEEQELKIQPFQRFVIVAEDQCSMEDFEKIRNKSNTTCHLFDVNSTNGMEWITSKGSPQELRKYQKESGYIKESEIFKSSVQNVNVITAKSGMGKSVMLKYLKNNISSDFWIVHIYLREHVSFFEKGHNLSEIVEYFLGDQAKRMKYDEFAKKIRHVFKSTSNIVFLWDGLDELPNHNLKYALKALEDLSMEGFKNWITARDHLQTILEDRFNIFASTIKIMDRNKQELYIKGRLESKCGDNQIEAITQKITTTIARTGDLGFLGIPLHISILTELFIQDAEKYSNLLENITLSHMIEYSVEEKLNFCYKERNYEMNDPLLKRTVSNYKQNRISQYEIIALKTFLPNNILDDLCVNCEEVLADIKSSKDEFGIVTRVNDNYTATFIHNIYGEFFVANWMAKNLLLVPQFKNFFFQETYNNIRLIFDVILAKNCPAHLAVLYKDFANLRERSEGEINQRDEKGRSPLHLACSWGEKRPVLPVRKEADSFIIDDTAAQLAKEDSSEYVNILDFLIREKKCNPSERDALFQWNATEYADSSLSLSAIEAINAHSNLDLKLLQKFRDDCNILYYGVKFGYMTLLEKIEIVPYIEVEVNRNNMLHEAIIYERNGFLKKILETDTYSKQINKKNCERRQIYIQAAMPYLLKPPAPVLNSTKRSILKSLYDIRAQLYKTLEQAPLHTATINGNIKAIEILLERTDNPYIVDNYDHNALHLAVMHEHLVIVKMLLKKGFKKDEVNVFHQNILHIAAKTGNWKLTNFILKLSVTSHTDWYGFNPIDYAVSYNYQQIMELMLQEMPFMLKKDLMPTLLMTAVLYGQVDIISTLIRNGARVDVEILFNVALVNGNTDAIRFLLENVVITDKAEFDYTFPLLWTIDQGELNTARCLINQGASVNTRYNDCYGLTLLHYAALYGREEMVKLLLSKGATPDELDFKKSTPLHCGTLMGHLSVVEQLLNKGASCNKTDAEGMTPLLISVKKGHKEVAEFLIENHSKYGINIDIRDKNGLNPLLFSVIEEDLYMIKLLLENEADITVRYNEGGGGVLHQAIFAKAEVLTVLIQHGADVNMMDQFGNTPLHLANFNSKSECAKILIENGANVFAKNIYGLIPLDIILEPQNENMLEVYYYLTTNTNTLPVCAIPSTFISRKCVRTVL